MKFYRSDWFTILMYFIFWPVGVYLTCLDDDPEDPAVQEQYQHSFFDVAIYFGFLAYGFSIGILGALLL